MSQKDRVGASSLLAWQFPHPSPSPGSRIQTSSSLLIQHHRYDIETSVTGADVVKLWQWCMSHRGSSSPFHMGGNTGENKRNELKSYHPQIKMKVFLLIFTGNANSVNRVRELLCVVRRCHSL